MGGATSIFKQDHDSPETRRNQTYRKIGVSYCQKHLFYGMPIKVTHLSAAEDTLWICIDDEKIFDLPDHERTPLLNRLPTYPKAIIVTKEGNLDAQFHNDQVCRVSSIAIRAVTQEPPPPEAPTLVSSSAHELKVRWDISQPLGIIQRAEVHFARVRKRRQHLLWRALGTREWVQEKFTEHTLDRLKPVQTFVFRVRIKNHCGWSRWSETSEQFTTEPTEPDEPHPPVCTHISNNFAKLYWVAPDDNGAEIKEYILQGKAAGDEVTELYRGPLTSFVVWGLHAGYAYTFEVCAINAVGAGPFSGGSSIKTLQENIVKRVAGVDPVAANDDEEDESGTSNQASSESMLGTRDVWMECWDQKTQQKFYFCRLTGERTLDVPRCFREDPNVPGGRGHRSRTGGASAGAGGSGSGGSGGGDKNSSGSGGDNDDGTSQDPVMQFRKKRYRFWRGLRKGNFGAGGAGRNDVLKLKMRRSQIVSASYEALTAAKHRELKARTNIEFEGEEAIDSGGVSKEFFLLLSRNLSRLAMHSATNVDKALRDAQALSQASGSPSQPAPRLGQKLGQESCLYRTPTGHLFFREDARVFQGLDMASFSRSQWASMDQLDDEAGEITGEGEKGANAKNGSATVSGPSDPQLRDDRQDALRLREDVAADDTETTEGETRRFSTDPETLNATMGSHSSSSIHGGGGGDAGDGPETASPLTGGKLVDDASPEAQNMRTGRDRRSSLANIAMDPEACELVRDPLELCRFMGLVVGKAMFDRQILDMPFHIAVFKHMRGEVAVERPSADSDDEDSDTESEVGDFDRSEKVVDDITPVSETRSPRQDQARGKRKEELYAAPPTPHSSDGNANRNGNCGTQQRRRRNVNALSMKDLATLDEELHKSLQWMMHNSIDDILFETFTVPVGTRDIALCENGDNRDVTDANKAEYVELRLKWITQFAINRQLEAFLEGFHTLIPESALLEFTADEIEGLVNGKPVVDVDEIRAYTMFQGDISEDSPVVMWLWQLLREMSTDDQRLFLKFVTGTDRVPLDGYDPPFTLTEGVDMRRDSLPRAHTCFNQLVIPTYSAYELMRKQFLLALKNTEGFALA